MRDFPHDCGMVDTYAFYLPRPSSCYFASYHVIDKQEYDRLGEYGVEINVQLHAFSKADVNGHGNVLLLYYLFAPKYVIVLFPNLPQP